MKERTPEERKRRHRNERIVAAAIVLIAAVTAAELVYWNRSEEKALRSDLRYIPKTATITPEVELLRTYVRIDSSTSAGEVEAARWLAGQLEARGIRAELIPSADRVNVYARIRGRARGGALLLFNHVDVVPAPASGWAHPPFAADVVGNEMYGRGTIDMKALAICQMLAMAALVRDRVTPAHDIVFLATADEETGSPLGMQWLLQNRPDVFEGIGYGITEGGITEITSEVMTYFGIEVGGKQRVGVTLEAASLDEMRRARFALEPYIDSREPERVLPQVRHMFARLASSRIRFKPLLENIDGALAAGKAWLLPFAYRDLLQNRVVVGVPHMDGGRAVMTVGLWNLPDEIPDARIAWLSRLVAPYGARVHAVTQKDGPVPLSSDATPLFEVLASEAQQRYSVSAGPQILYTSVTDARFLRPRGIECYGVCPYPVNYYQSVTMHKPNERIRLDWFMDGVGYMDSVVRRWARG